ncbi:UNVERIFIED_CONTAM: hypothetical protein GTU68_002078, partial [Idotea baltica]|nr:hypothetical protein [Idotea baltica]
MKAIQQIAVIDRPREKLSNRGASSLNDYELISVILGSGTREIGVHQLAKLVVELFSTKNGSTSYKDLLSIKGIGPAKASTLSASLEFARRQIRPEGIKISCAKDIYNLLRHIGTRKQEHFICISLNGANEVIATRILTIGLLNSSQVHPREVFSEAITDRAAAIIIAHNHPSGNLTPSEADYNVTKIIKNSGNILGIKLLDHVIFSSNGFCSLRD